MEVGDPAEPGASEDPLVLRDKEQINEETFTGDSYSGAASCLSSGLRRMDSNKHSRLLLKID